MISAVNFNHLSFGQLNSRRRGPGKHNSNNGELERKQLRQELTNPNPAFFSAALSRLTQKVKPPKDLSKPGRAESWLASVTGISDKSIIERLANKLPELLKRKVA